MLSLNYYRLVVDTVCTICLFLRLRVLRCLLFRAVFPSEGTFCSLIEKMLAIHCLISTYETIFQLPLSACFEILKFVVCDLAIMLQFQQLPGLILPHFCVHQSEILLSRCITIICYKSTESLTVYPK